MQEQLDRTESQVVVDSELKYRRLFEAAQDGILILDGDTGEIKDVNPFLIDMLGYKRNELLGKQLWEIGVFKDKEASEKAYEKLQKEGYVRYEHLPLENKDKQPIEVEFVSNVYQVGDSRIIQCNIRDVTAHMKLDRLLRQSKQRSEKKFHFLFDTMKQGVVFYNSQGMIILMNPAAEHILGIKIDEVAIITSIERRASSICEDGSEFPGENHPALVALKTGRPVLNVVMGIFNRLEEKYRWIMIDAIPQFKTGESRTYQVYTIFTDITDFIKSQAALRDSDERYKALFNRSNDLVYLHDLEGNFIEANNIALSVLGYSGEEIRKLKFTSLLSQDQIPTALKTLQEIKKTGTQKEIDEYRLKCKNGKHIYMETKAVAVHDNKKPSAILGIGRDITQRKQADEELNLRARLLDSANDSIMLHDPEGKFIYVNEAACVSHGYSRKELMKMSLKELDVPEYAELIQSRVKETIEKGNLVFETAHFCKDGSVIQLEMHTQVVATDGKKLVLSVARDITQRKIQEDLLQRAMEGTIHSMAAIVEKRDPYTSGHQKGVAKLASAIAKEMCLSKERIKAVAIAGTIHDIGKINIPSEILSRPGKLGETEMNLIKNHPQIGYEMLKEVELPWEICPMVLQHHERMDGSGYPSGLSGGDIMLEARIIAVADVVEAMTSHRPYRPALGIGKALEEILKNKGKLYDPDVANACLKLFEEKRFEF